MDDEWARSQQAGPGGWAEHSNAFYDLNSSSYGDRTGSVGFPPLLDRFIEAMPRGGSAVDLGCGAGRDLARLRAANLDCIGYDLSPGLASLARARSGAPVFVADIRAVEIPKGSLDGALAVASLLHLQRQEIQQMLMRIATWLRPSGLLLATMKAGSGSTLDAEGRRFTFVRSTEWRSMLAVAGFEELETSGSRADRDVSSSGHAWIATLARRS